MRPSAAPALPRRILYAFGFLGGYFHKKQASQGAICGHKSVFIVTIDIPPKAQVHANHASTRLAYLTFAWVPMGSDVAVTYDFFNICGTHDSCRIDSD